MESNLSKIEIRWIQSKLDYTRFLAIENTSLLCRFKFVNEILYTALTLALSDLNRKEMKEF